MSFAPSGTLDAAFWQRQAQRFVALRQPTFHESKRPLAASYHPGSWGLDGVRAFRGRTSGCWLLDHGPLTAVDEFKSIAGVCAVALGAPNTDAAWVEWLDCLRRESFDFKAAELVSDSWYVEWRPEPNVEVVAPGLLWEPVETRPDADAKIVSTELGEIDDVCGASERLCRRLADEALKTELTSTSDILVDPLTTRNATDTSSSVGAGTRNAESKTLGAPDRSRTMTLKEAANALRVSDDTLHRMRKKREIKMFKIGSRWRVLASEVIRLRQQPKFENR